MKHVILQVLINSITLCQPSTALNVEKRVSINDFTELSSTVRLNENVTIPAVNRVVGTQINFGLNEFINYVEI